MKTFKDLEFKPHKTGDGKQAVMFFDNGYGISVVRFKIGFSGLGYGSYTSNESEWEIAVLTGDKDEYRLTYNTHITDDVIGHLSNDGVTEIMENIQSLKSCV